MSCPTAEEWILLSMDLLDEGHAKRMHAHLKACDTCRVIFDEAKKSHADLMRAHDEMNRNHDMLRDRLEAALSADTVRPPVPGPPVRGWRRLGGFLMDHPNTRRAAGLLSAAAAVVFILFLVLNPNGQVAFGSVIEQLQKIKTMACRTSTRIEVKGHEITLDGRIFLSSDHGARCDFSLHGQQVWGVYKPAGGPIVMTSALFQSSMEKPVKEPDSLTDQMHEPDTFLQQLRTLTADVSEPLGTVVCDGLEAEGFRIAPGRIKFAAQVPISVRLYVDPSTVLPIKIVVDMPEPVSGMRFNIAYDRFEWDLPIDARIFTPVIPDDYSRGMLEFPPENETTLIVGLRFFADLTGSYPDELDVDQVSRDVNRLSIEYLVKHGKDLAHDVERFKALPRKLMTMISACRFFRKLERDGNRPEYFGSIVVPDDSDKPLVRWHMKDGRLRIIYGDLRCEER